MAPWFRTNLLGMICCSTSVGALISRKLRNRVRVLVNIKKGRSAALVRCLDPLRVQRSVFVFSSTAVGPLGRWQTLLKCPNSCAAATESPLASPWWFSTLGLEPSLQRGAVHKSRGRRNNVPTASASLTLAGEVVRPVPAASLACPAKPAHRPSSRRCPRPTSCSRRSSRARHWLC